MKKFALIAIAFMALTWLSASAQTRNGLVLTNTQTAIDYMYSNGLTMFSTESTFMASQSLRRDEAAAFFARFSRDVLGNTPDTSKTECNTFTDLSLGHHDLQSEMIASCQLWLMRGSDGKFMPTQSFSNAHAMTVLIRLIDGEKSEDNGHRATNYYNTAWSLGLLNGLSASQFNNLDVAISRGDVAKLIEAAAYHTHGGIAQTPTNQNTSPNYISAEDRSLQQRNDSSNVCWYRKTDWLPTNTWGQDAKFINSKLQYVRDNGQQYTQTFIDEAYNILSDSSINTAEKCRQSWLIDELSKQRGYVRSFETENWVTTIGIDFISLQDDISKIQYDGPPSLELYKNSSLKVRYYTLSNNPELQTLDLDNHGYVLGEKYINNFNTWLNEHCNNNPIYNWLKKYEEIRENWVIVREWYTEEINRKEFNWTAHFCVKDRLKEEWSRVTFQFNANWDLQKIDLNRRHLITAW